MHVGTNNIKYYWISESKKSIVYNYADANVL